MVQSGRGGAFQAEVSRYAQTGQHLMRLLGIHPDATTAAASLPLPLQTSVCLSELGSGRAGPNFG